MIFFTLIVLLLYGCVFSCILMSLSLGALGTVNPEFFARILFSRITLKDIHVFVTLEKCD